MCGPRYKKKIATYFSGNYESFTMNTVAVGKDKTIQSSVCDNRRCSIVNDIEYMIHTGAVKKDGQYKAVFMTITH